MKAKEASISAQQKIVDLEEQVRNLEEELANKDDEANPYADDEAEKEEHEDTIALRAVNV